MAYSVYLGGILLPVTPGAIDVRIGSKNQTVELIDGRDVTIIKGKGIPEISFTFPIPQVWVPFLATFSQEIKPAVYYLTKFGKFKDNKSVLDFVIMRHLPNGKTIFDSSRKVTLEDINYTESAENGYDFEVTLTLKEWREYTTKTIGVQKSSNTAVVNPQRCEQREKAKTYTVKSGDTLWKIAKMFLGDGAKYTTLANINNISDPNFLRVGQVVKLQ